MPVRRGGSTLGDTMKKVSMHQNRPGYNPNYPGGYPGPGYGQRPKPKPRPEPSVEDIKNKILGTKPKPPANTGTGKLPPDFLTRIGEGVRKVKPVYKNKAIKAPVKDPSLCKKAGITSYMPKAVSDWWRKNKTEGLPKKTFPGMKNPNLRDPKENK